MQVGVLQITRAKVRYIILILNLIYFEGLNGETYDDDLPYTTLSYSDGPGFENWYEVNGNVVARKDLTQDAEELKTFDSAR